MADIVEARVIHTNDQYLILFSELYKLDRIVVYADLWTVGETYKVGDILEVSCEQAISASEVIASYRATKIHSHYALRRYVLAGTVHYDRDGFMIMTVEAATVDGYYIERASRPSTMHVKQKEVERFCEETGITFERGSPIRVLAFYCRATSAKSKWLSYRIMMDGQTPEQVDFFPVSREPDQEITLQPSATPEKTIGRIKSILKTENGRVLEIRTRFCHVVMADENSLTKHSTFPRALKVGDYVQLVYFKTGENEFRAIKIYYASEPVYRTFTLEVNLSDGWSVGGYPLVLPEVPPTPVFKWHRISDPLEMNHPPPAEIVPNPQWYTGVFLKRGLPKVNGLIRLSIEAYAQHPDIAPFKMCPQWQGILCTVVGPVVEDDSVDAVQMPLSQQETMSPQRRNHSTLSFSTDGQITPDKTTSSFSLINNAELSTLADEELVDENTIDDDVWSAVLVVGQGDQREELRVAKELLIMASVDFERMFEEQLGNFEHYDSVELGDDFNAGQVRELLRHIYPMPAETIESFEELKQLAPLAHKYHMVEVANRCERFLWERSIEMDGFSILEYVDRFGYDRLKSKCWRTICEAKSLDDVRSDHRWRQLSGTLRADILEHYLDDIGRTECSYPAVEESPQPKPLTYESTDRQHSGGGASLKLVIGQERKTHLFCSRELLMLVSPILRQLLDVEGTTLSLENVDPQEMINLLNHIHPSVRQPISDNSVMGLARLAAMYQIRSVKSTCQSFLFSGRSQMPTTQKLLIADQNNYQRLATSCCTEICRTPSSFKETLASEYWKLLRDDRRLELHEAFCAGLKMEALRPEHYQPRS